MTGQKELFSLPREEEEFLAEKLKVQVFEAGSTSAFAVRKPPTQGAPVTETGDWASPRTAGLSRKRCCILCSTPFSHPDHCFENTTSKSARGISREACQRR